MNALPVWDAEQRTSAPVPADPAAPVPLHDALHVDALHVDALHVDPLSVPEIAGDPRRLSLARALAELDTTTSPIDAVVHLLAAVDAADARCGIARVDTSDALLQHRIARIVSGAAMPSRGPATRAREILALLHGGATA